MVQESSSRDEEASGRSSPNVRRAHGLMRGFAIALGWLCLPLMLVLPAVFLLYAQATLQRDAGSLLRAPIAALAPGLADLSSLGSVQSNLLARKQIVERLQDAVLPAADALGLIGQLPKGVQLSSLQIQARQLALTIRSGDKADELALLDLLARNGYADLRIGERMPQGDAMVAHVKALARDTPAMSSSIPGSP